MAVLNRQMFRQPFPVVRRQGGTPIEGEVQENKPFFGGVWGALRGMTSNTGWENQDQGKFAALIEKTDSMITIINKLVANRQITSDKGAELTDIITSERRKTNPNLQLLDDLYNQIVVGAQEFEEGYETWQKEDQQLRDDTMRAEEFMDTPIATDPPLKSMYEEFIEEQNVPSGAVDTTGIDPSRFGDYRKRQMGSPPMGEQVNANNVGIMDGFEGEQVAQQVMVKGSAAKEEIDQASTYDELMQSIRGDDLSEHDRRQELASVVGEEDAYKTPDSVLALVQPVMQMMDTETANTGIGQIEEGQQMANVKLPQRPVGIAHGGYLRKIPGYAESSPLGVTQEDTELSSDQWANLAQILGLGQPNLETSYEDRLPLYTDILKGSATSPDVLAGQTWGDVSQAAFAWGQGASPGEAMNFLSQNLIKRASATDKEKRAMDIQLKLAALKAAEGDVQLEKTLLNKIETKKLEQDAKDKKGTSYVKSLIGQTEEAPIYAEIPDKFEDIVGLNELIATLTEGTTVFLDHNDKLTITPPTLDPKGTSYLKTADSVIPTAFGEIEGLVDVIGTLPIGTNIFVDKNDQVKITEPTKDEKGTSYMKTADAVIPTEFEKIAGLNDLIGTLPEGTNIHVDSKNKTTITLPKEPDSEPYYDMVNKKVVWYTDGELNSLISADRDNLTTVGEGTSWVKMRITKAPLKAGGDDIVDEIDVRLFDVDDYKNNGYIIIPNSQITIGEKKGLFMAEGGPVVKRQKGTDEKGEGDDLEVSVPLQYTEEEILKEFRSDQPVLETPAAKDQAKKLVAAGDLALKNLVKLKNLILVDPTLAGAQGQIIESGRDIFQILNSIENSVLGDIIWKDEKEGGWVEWFDKPEIESISRLKSDIAAALGDLRYFKGARQPNWMVNLQATREADVTGLFGHEKALAKIDSMAIKLADLLKYYTSLSGNTLEDRQTQIDTLVKRIHNMQAPEDTTEISIGGMTMDQVKENLPPEMLEAIDTDPNVMDAITAIMKGADVELVIERFNELKQAE